MRPEQGGFVFDASETPIIRMALAATMQRNQGELDAYRQVVSANHQRRQAGMPERPVPELSQYVRRVAELHARLNAHSDEARINYDDAVAAARSLGSFACDQRQQQKQARPQVRRSRFGGAPTVRRPTGYGERARRADAIAAGIRSGLPRTK